MQYVKHPYRSSTVPFVGGWIFRTLGIGTPFSGLAGVIFVAFIGAVVVLFAVHVVAGRRRLT